MVGREESLLACWMDVHRIVKSRLLSLSLTISCNGNLLPLNGQFVHREHSPFGQQPDT